jgi:hypothetical protein
MYVPREDIINFQTKEFECETSTISLLLQEVEASVGTEFLVMNCIVKVFKRIIDNRFDLNHLFTVKRLEFSLVSKIPGFLSTTIRLVSSMKRIDIAVSAVAWGRSLIYNKNNRGPKTEPCGTPC